MALRLKDLPANQVPFWYQEFVREEEELDENENFTGEPKKIYANPVRKMARISPSVGEGESNPFGASVIYDKSISTVVRLPINEYSRLFIDIEPILNEDGSTDTEADYYCVAQKHDIHQNVWAIRKVTGGTQ